VNVDNYGLTLVDLKNLGHKDDLWVLADRVAQVFYVLDPETVKHIVVSEKQKIVGVDNVEDNDEDQSVWQCGTHGQSVWRDTTIHQSNEHQAHRERLWQESFALYAKRWQRKICMI
jgi:hypothetical protein